MLISRPCSVSSRSSSLKDWLVTVKRWFKECASIRTAKRYPYYVQTTIAHRVKVMLIWNVHRFLSMALLLVFKDKLTSIKILFWVCVRLKINLLVNFRKRGYHLLRNTALEILNKNMFKWFRKYIVKNNSSFWMEKKLKDFGIEYRN